MKTLKIAMIMPYFGSAPVWIDLYLYSCSRNELIDWYFFTDCIQNDAKYKNVYIKEITFHDFCQRVSFELGVKFTPSGAYKLCDLRPFYGYLFKEEIQKYSFWGFGDVDIIWGNIHKFYTDELLDKYDVFSTLNDRLSGHFTLIRNDDKYNHLCFKINNWKEKLEDNKNYALDEADFSRLIIPQYTKIGKFYRRIMMKYLGWKLAWDIYYRVFPFIHFLYRTRKKRLYFNEQHTTPFFNSDGRLYKYEAETWFYENDKITNNKTDKEYIYLHFMVYKKNAFREKYYWKENFYHLTDNSFNKRIIINKMGFFEADKIKKESQFIVEKVKNEV